MQTETQPQHFPTTEENTAPFSFDALADAYVKGEVSIPVAGDAQGEGGEGAKTESAAIGIERTENAEAKPVSPTRTAASAETARTTETPSANNVADTSATSANASAAFQKPRRYRMVFFDLDGTLLPMDTHAFLDAYMKNLGAFMAEHGINQELGMKALFGGIKAMGENDGTVSNHDVFWRTYEHITGQSAAEVEPLFMQFYRGPFNAIAALAQPNPAAARAVATLKRKGYRVALTTMPMFPLEAVHARLRWAGLDPADFDFVTDYASSSCVKPDARYYRQALNRAGVAGEDVLMVGNHAREDGLATKVGCDIYFATDHLLEHKDGLNVAQCKHGTMEEFAAFCEALPDCEQ